MPGAFFFGIKNDSAAASGATAAAAATATTTRHRNPGGDGEARAHAAFDKIDLDSATVLHQIVVNQEGQTTFLNLEIIIFWLIQSQAQ